MKIKNLKNTIRYNLKTYKKLLIIFSIVLLGVLFFFLFTPYHIILLIIGVLLVFYGYFYITDKKISKKKKNKGLILVILFSSVIYIGSFISFHYDSKQSHSTLKETNTGMIFSENGYIDGEGRTFAYEQDTRNRQGEIDPKGTLRLPSSESICHKLPDRDNIESLTYDIAIVTNFELVDNEITLYIWGSKTDKEDDRTEDTLQEVVLTFIQKENESEWDYGDFEYYAESIDEVNGYYEDYEYLFFVFEGEIEGLSGIEQEAGYEADFWGDVGKAVVDTTKTAMDTCKQVLNPLTKELEKIKEKMGEWLYSQKTDKSFAEMMTDQIASLKILTLIMTAILICFIVCFLLMFITGTLRHMKHLLMMLTMSGFLVMMAMMVYSEDFEIIALALKIIDKIPSAKVQDILKMVVKMIGYIMAIILWAWTVGSALAICWLLYIILWKVMDFAKDIFEQTTILMNDKRRGKY